MKCPERKELYVNKDLGYTLYSIINPTDECKACHNYHTAIGLNGYLCFEPLKTKGKQSKLETELESEWKFVEVERDES